MTRDWANITLTHLLSIIVKPFGGAGCAYERVNEHLVPLGALTVGLVNIRNLNIRTVFEAAWFVVQDS